MEWWEEYFSHYYHLTALSMNINAKKETDFILSVVHPQPGSRILDMCCGYGRHAIEMAVSGTYSVVGVDFSDKLIDRANIRKQELGLKNIQFSTGDVRDYKCPDTFDLVVNLFISFGFFDEAGNRRALKTLCDCVNDQGILVLELHNYLKVKFEAYEQQRVPGGYSFETSRTYDEKTKSLIIERTVSKKEVRKKYNMAVRIYDLDELLDISAEYGMEYACHFGGYDGTELNEESEHMLLFLKKVNSSGGKDE